MAAYIFAIDGIPIFDAPRAVIKFNDAGRPVNHAENVATITTDYGFPNDGSSPPRETPQLAMLMQFLPSLHL